LVPKVSLADDIEIAFSERFSFQLAVKHSFAHALSKLKSVFSLLLEDVSILHDKFLSVWVVQLNKE